MKNSKAHIPLGPTVKVAQQCIHLQKEGAWVYFTKKYGKNFWYQGTVVTADPAVIEQLLMEKTHTQKRSMVYRYLYKLIPLAHGLLFLDGQAWQQRLQAVMPVFTRPNVGKYAAFMHQQLSDTLGQWAVVYPIPDIYVCVVNLNAQLLMKLGYGLEPGSAYAQQLSNILVHYKFDLMDTETRLDSFGIQPGLLKRLPKFLKAEWNRRKQRIKLHALVAAMVRDGALLDNDGLNWIRCLHQAGFKARAIAAELNHLYGAYNALDYSITCALYELGRRPDWLKRLRQELAITDQLPVGITHQHFVQIPDTIHFMQEVFRYYPVSMGISRRTGATIQTDAVEIPAGQEVLIALYAVHHHPDYWQEPDAFDPDRWQALTPIPFTYVPFLKGSRHCIGRHMAELNFINFIRVWVLNGHLQLSDASMHLASYMIPRFEQTLTGTYVQ